MAQTFFGIPIGTMCVVDTMEMASNADIVPGSSGGVVLDDDDQVVGVVSAGDGHFGYFVSTSDIRSFLTGF
jgi:V8-like Glu-specific endopeptidase